MGPEQGVGFVTLGRLQVTYNSSTATTVQIEPLRLLLVRVLAALIPGVYEDDVAIFISSGGSAHALLVDFEINTRVFGEDYTVSRTMEILVGAPVSDVEAAVRRTAAAVSSVALVAPVRAELRCLQDIVCPVLSCGPGELEYASRYPSVRRCCSICIPGGLHFHGCVC